MIAVLDFGSQYTQLIVRRIRELKIYCEIFPYNVSEEILKEKGIKVIILSGGPGSANEQKSYLPDKRIFEGDYLILGICYGMQIMGKIFGSNIIKGNIREYGKTTFYPEKDVLFDGIKYPGTVWMSHYDIVENVPEGFYSIGKTDTCPIAAFKNTRGTFYGLQFHPEVVHTQDGKKILENFLYNIAKIKPDWNSSSMVDSAIKEIKEKVGSSKVICALSGGVDSSTLSMLVHKAVGENALSVFVDNGLLRKNEAKEIVEKFSPMLNMRYIEAGDIFLSNLKGITDPEEKRKIIGKTFIKIFEKQAENFGARFLAQGTLYPDLIESISAFGGPTAKIKTHHNVGGLPEKMNLNLVEPFKYLFKDEIRMIAKEINLPKEITERHPFPGPGLAIRIIGEIDEEKLEILRDSDAIFIEEIKKEKI